MHERESRKVLECLKKLLEVLLRMFENTLIVSKFVSRASFVFDLHHFWVEAYQKL